MKKRAKITKAELRKIAAGARRSIDLEMGIGINNHHNTVDKKKENNKTRCRNKKSDD